ncbi:MAG TPA: VTT domain-containing protein [Elusimicrobiota bacterium]|nr:VTT domain-containing protein [Elusimicrobiota bacterium]
MIKEITYWLIEMLRQYGAWSVFGGVIIESIIVPIPSPAIIMGAGMILVPLQEPWGSALKIIFWQIVLPGSIASTIGAYLCYGIAYWGGKPLIEKVQRFFGCTWDDIAGMGARFSRSGAAPTLFFMRMIPIVPLSLVSLAAGVIRLDWKVFTIWTFLGSVPRCLILAILGWQLGNSALKLAFQVDRLESIISLLMVCGVIGVILYFRHRMRRAAKLIE